MFFRNDTSRANRLARGNKKILLFQLLNYSDWWKKKFQYPFMPTQFFVKSERNKRK